MKGVILAGGSGSRLAPLTRITNKHLLPLYDRPMVTYAVEALVAAGIQELMLVTGGTHAGEFFRLLGNGHDYGIDRLLYAYQERPGGIAAAQGRGARIVLSRVDDEEHLRHLGVAELDGDRVVRIVEKPDAPASSYAVTGVYFYDESVWQILPALDVSERGELEITDVNNWYLDRGELAADVLDGFWGDAGESIDGYYAVNDFVRRERGR